MAAPKHYSHEKRVIVLATLAANGGNITKTSRETGVSRPTLREWLANPTLQDLPEVAARKEELTAAYADRIKSVRVGLLDRMATLAQTETDLFKVSGAFKIVSEAAAEQETQEALAAAIRERAGEMN